MAFDRGSGRVSHHLFRELPSLQRPGDALVVNDTRVFPARLPVRKAATGGRAELLLLHRVDALTWEALAGGKGLRPETRLGTEGGPSALVVRELGGARRLIRFETPIEPHLDRLGLVPVPPYVHQIPADPNDYQTVYAVSVGSAAAPTAGMHFTQALLDRVQAEGMRVVRVTLHIGLDTFAPVTEARAEAHRIHTEWCQVTPDAAEALNAVRASGGRIVAVGTTAVRTLETAAQGTTAVEPIQPFAGATSLYILPGYEFRAVDALITNFHLPRSTLLMLVSAFAGRERLLALYQSAILEGYRFYSFGDAMLIT
jgi:S-adenosylmethionine:tRNA ribosyltransferase-isomerase